MRRMRRSRAAARLDGASVIYGGRGWGSRPVAAVDDVTLRIEPGQIFGLVGESGSGKSTIGRALAGLVPLSSGSATVDGVELAHASRAGAAGGAEPHRLHLPGPGLDA